jgi:amino acid adenylation domain-containing protein
VTVTATGLSEAKAALLAKYLRGGMPQSITGPLGIPHRPPGEHARLSFGQQQMWLLARMTPDRPVYTECVTIRMMGPLDVIALERSFNEIIRRHEIWRTTFSVVDEEPVQIVHPPTHFALPLVHLEGLPADQRETEALRLVTDDLRLPFDLARGPLLRLRLVKLDDAEHRLYLTLHHIIFDVASIYDVFMPELAAVYGAFSVGKASPLPEPAIQYADYAHWQRQQQREEALIEPLPYWREILHDAPVLQLPTDHPQPQQPTFHGALQPFPLSKALTGALKELSQREGVTLYMTLLTAFAIVLHRYAGQDDIVIGTPISSRDRPEIEKLMGFFLNTLALRVDLSENPTFREALHRVRHTTLDAHAQRGVPFEMVVNDLHPHRNAGQNPLFQVMFTLEPPRTPLDVPWSASMMDIISGTAKFDLSVELDDTGDGINGRFQYNADLFNADTMTRMVGHFRALLEGVVADPGQRVAALPLLTAGERRRMLVAWNATAAEYPRDRCFPDLFAAQAAATPAALAAVCEGERITYAALDRRANQLAHHLRAHGVGPGAVVGLCVERSLAMLVGLLAVLKAGGAYLPLDPAYPRDRLAFMLKDARVRVLLTEQRLAPLLPAGDAAVVCLDRDREAIARRPTDPPQSAATPEGLAYVIYTSGSTGTPKGVMIPHRALVNLLCAMRAHLGLTDRDVLLAGTSLSFDIAGLELYLPLLVGACVVIAPRAVATHGRRLAALIAECGATVMQATPTTWRMLIEAGWQGSRALHILCGGEALPQGLARQLLHAGGRLTNLYGPTETTIWSTLHAVEDAERPVPLGRPIANTQVYLLDRHRRPVPVGVPGELYIGGDGLARGYLHRPALTAARFVTWSGPMGRDTRLYATGDRARYRPDGAIEYLGRSDHQVKLRGFRIEPGEVEALLERHDGVRQAVVMVREDTPGNAVLAAYLVPAREPAPSVGALREALASALPDYMVPAAFVLLDALPTTPNGKVDRQALPAPSAVASAGGRPFVAPEGILQLQLARIWEEVLAVRPVGITDDFFALGGTSLLAARLVDRIADVCGRSLPLASLFAGATIAHIEAALLDRTGEGPRAPVVRVQEGDTTRRPFFYLHGDLRDGGLYALKLARALDPSLPFYAIHPAGTDGTAVPATLEAIAAERLAALRAVQPAGPYLLGGFCAGAFVAFEMARQLRDQGERVDALALVEQDIAGAEIRIARAAIGLWGRVAGLDHEKQQQLFLRLRRYRVARSMGSHAPAWLTTFPPSDSALTKGLSGLGRLLRPGRRAAPARPLPAEEAGDARSRRTFELECRYMWAISAYRPRRYRGRAAMFWASEGHSKSIGELATGWEDVIEAMEVYATPGTHFSSITDHAEALAARMRAWLDAGEAPSERA